MILYFNKNGQLLEKLEYGSAPRAGTTKFQIFAYFADLQPNDGNYDNYSVAMIRLRRPDLEGSEYPDLFMTTSSITFNSSIETSKNNTFQNGTTYYGFVFDFSKIKNIQEDAFIKLLDISGMWRATITLMNRNSGNYVTGLVQFNVEGSVNDIDEEPQQLEYEVIQQNIADLLQSYALKTWVQNNYVPYQGATNDVNLGNHSLAANSVDIYNTHNNNTIWCGGFGSSSNGKLYIESENEVVLDTPQVTIDGILSVSDNLLIGGYEAATKNYVDTSIANIDVTSLHLNAVPYTGAERDVNLGTHSLWATTVLVDGKDVATEDWVTNNFIGKGWVIIEDGGLTYQYTSQELEDSYYLSINAYGITVGHNIDGDETLIELPITNHDETVAYHSWVDSNFLKQGEDINLGNHYLKTSSYISLEGSLYTTLIDSRGINITAENYDFTLDFPVSENQSETIATQEWVQSQGYVPYTNATNDVVLGEHRVEANELRITGMATSSRIIRGNLSGWTGATEDDMVIENGDGNIFFGADGYIGYAGSNYSHSFTYIYRHTVTINSADNQGEKVILIIYDNNYNAIDTIEELRDRVFDGDFGKFISPCVYSDQTHTFSILYMVEIDYGTSDSYLNCNFVNDFTNFKISTVEDDVVEEL